MLACAAMEPFPPEIIHDLKSSIITQDRRVVDTDDSSRWKIQSLDQRDVLNVNTLNPDPGSTRKIPGAKSFTKTDSKVSKRLNALIAEDENSSLQSKNHLRDDVQRDQLTGCVGTWMRLFARLLMCYCVWALLARGGTMCDTTLEWETTDLI